MGVVNPRVVNMAATGKGTKRKSLKQQLRDTRRLLSKEDLPETVRQSKERIRNMLMDEIKDKEKEDKKKKVNRKYKMVKFFEKRKVTRRLKSLTNQLKRTTDEERESLLSEMSKLRGDLNYITHFPYGQKYLALYPTSKTSNKSLQLRDEIYQNILSQINDGVIPDVFDSIGGGTDSTELDSVQKGSSNSIDQRDESDTTDGYSISFVQEKIQEATEIERGITAAITLPSGDKEITDKCEVSSDERITKRTVKRLNNDPFFM